MSSGARKRQPKTGRQPRLSPLLSLCMIVRDEERFLKGCLESVAGLVEEIIVVDTGSQDSTVSIARQFKARVLPYSWNDDFGAARNQALNAATGRWLLVLDADERLDPAAAPPIRQALAEGQWDTGFIHFVNMSGHGPCGRQWLAARLFRRTPGMRYLGRIHEQMVHQIPVIRPRIIDAVAYHYGYQASVYSERHKRDRNTRLLEQSLADPQLQDPLLKTNYMYHHANLATNQELLRRYAEFVDYIRQQWPQDPPRAPWITGGLAEYARLLNDVGRYQESRCLAQELLERHGEAPLLRYLLARAAAVKGDLETTEMQLEKILKSAPEISPEHMQYTQDVALVISRARFLRGLIREKQGCLEEAVSHYRASVEEEPEQEFLRRQLACALVRLGRHQEALEAIERSADLVGQPQPGIDCLALALALTTRSVARLGLWGEKVRNLASSFAPAARMLERMEQLGPQWAYRLEDFPEIVSGILPPSEPGAVAMPQTSRKSNELPQ